MLDEFPPVFKARLFRQLYRPVIMQSYLLWEVSNAFIDMVACEVLPGPTARSHCAVPLRGPTAWSHLRPAARRRRRPLWQRALLSWRPPPPRDRCALLFCLAGSALRVLLFDLQGIVQQTPPAATGKTISRTRLSWVRLLAL